MPDQFSKYVHAIVQCASENCMSAVKDRAANSAPYVGANFDRDHPSVPVAQITEQAPAPTLETGFHPHQP